MSSIAENSNNRVGVTCTHLQRDIGDYQDRFLAAGFEIVLPEIPGQELAGDELVAAMRGLVGVVAGDDQFTEEVMKELPQMRVISKWGIGLDGIDLPAAERLGITVTNTPGMFGNEVAEQGLGYLIALVRGIVMVDSEVRSGSWPKPVGRSLGSLKACVIGLGNIGQSLVEKLQALGLEVCGIDPSPEAAQWAAGRGVGIGEPIDMVDGIDFEHLSVWPDPHAGVYDELSTKDEGTRVLYVQRLKILSPQKYCGIVIHWIGTIVSRLPQALLKPRNGEHRVTFFILGEQTK